MVKLYLITGFLGAGKTTLLKNMVRLFAGERLAILVNEFGREDVDGKLLGELHVQLEEIHNGSIFCACRLDQFESSLSALLDNSPDTILVETSGLSDPSGIGRLLAQPLFADRIDYRGCICIVDAMRFEKVLQTAVSCRKQLAVSDIVVINKTDLADENRKQYIRELIRRHGPAVPVFETSYGEMRQEWLDALAPCVGEKKNTGIQTRDLSLQSFTATLQDGASVERLEAFLQEMAHDTHRIKGFVSLNGQSRLVDCVGEAIAVHPSTTAARPNNKLIILAGHGKPARKTLHRSLFQG